MSAAEHIVIVRTRPFGGTRTTKAGSIVRADCSCGRNVATGDNYGRTPLDQVEAYVRRALQEMHAERALVPEGEHT